MSLRTASAKLEKGKKHSDEEPTHHTTLKGYCKKRSTKGKWQKRFFQAHTTTLTYKSTEKSSKILGSIDLKTVGAIISDGSATGFSLQLADRVYKLQVVKGSPPAEEWIKGLNARQLSFAVFSGEETSNDEKEQQESSSSTTGSTDVVVEEKEESQRLATSQSSSSSSSSSTIAPGGKAVAQNSSAAAAVAAAAAWYGSFSAQTRERTAPLGVCVTRCRDSLLYCSSVQFTWTIAGTVPLYGTPTTKRVYK